MPRGKRQSRGGRLANANSCRFLVLRKLRDIRERTEKRESERQALLGRIAFNEDASLSIEVAFLYLLDLLSNFRSADN